MPSQAVLGPYHQQIEGIAEGEVQVTAIRAMSQERDTGIPSVLQAEPCPNTATLFAEEQQKDPLVQEISLSAE